MQERARLVVVNVVKEVLLELIENEIRIVGVPNLGEGIFDRAGPRVAQRDDGPGLEGAQLSHDAGGEQRRLADAALAVEHGQPRSE